MIAASSLDNCSTCYIFVCEWIFHRRFENGRMDDECIGGEDRSVCLVISFHLAVVSRIGQC